MRALTPLMVMTVSVLKRITEAVKLLDTGEGTIMLIFIAIFTCLPSCINLSNIDH